MTDYQYFTLGLIVLIFLVATLIVRVARAVVQERVDRTAAGPDDRTALQERVVILTRALALLIYGVAAIAGVALAVWRYAPGETSRSLQMLTAGLVSRGLNAIIIVVGAMIVVRLASVAIVQLQHRLVRRHQGTDLEWQRRASTLSGILSRLVTVSVAFVAVLMLLRELSIDVVPILTGAGIAGLAVGFGAQNLVRDVISGFFMILEDQVRVGDLARINGVTGSVEEINLRTIVARDAEGAVHVFPNGTITALANLSKLFAYAVVDVRVAYSENLDRVMGTLSEVGESIHQDPALGLLVHGPLEIVGVESIDNGVATIRTRFKTLPLNQGRVANELRQRIVTVFAARGIKPYGGTSR